MQDFERAVQAQPPTLCGSSLQQSLLWLSRLVWKLWAWVRPLCQKILPQAECEVITHVTSYLRPWCSCRGHTNVRFDTAYKIHFSSSMLLQNVNSDLGKIILCFYQNHGEALTITKRKKENEETEDKNQKSKIKDLQGRNNSLTSMGLIWTYGKWHSAEKPRVCLERREDTLPYTG